MQVSSFSDYALRILMSLASVPDRTLSVRSLAERHGLSFDHLAKVGQFLAREGFVEATRGRGGGLRLARPADEIMIGDVLRRSEACSGLVECLRPGAEVRCVLAPVCGLSPILAEAEEAFFARLDRRSIADAVPQPAQVRAAIGADG
ncbi:MAG: Rrf2 family transcriptional regulator [Alphaproteobacteria bacterium]|nr:MAG: Rrf2 family transcriptional regulator [Alphaproteobacteria bacterium]